MHAMCSLALWRVPSFLQLAHNFPWIRLDAAVFRDKQDISIGSPYPEEALGAILPLMAVNCNAWKALLNCICELNEVICLR